MRKPFRNHIDCLSRLSGSGGISVVQDSFCANGSASQLCLCSSYINVMHDRSRWLNFFKKALTSGWERSPGQSSPAKASVYIAPSD